MIRNFILFIALYLAFISCRQHNHLTADQKKEMVEEIKMMMNNYYNDVKSSGLVTEFKYLDSSKDFSWIPPGYSKSISYDSVAHILTSNAAGFKSILNTWETLEILPLSKELATYSSRINSRVTDTSGMVTNTILLETGTVIKRKDGWKLLSGQTSILPNDHASQLFKADSVQLDLFAKQIANRNNTGILKIDFNGDTMSIVSDGDLTWKPLGVNSNPNAIKQKFHPLFTKKDTTFYDSVTKKSISGITLLSPLSTIFFKRLSKEELQSEDDAEHHNEKKKSVMLHYALIKDTIPLAYGLKVDMLKKNFFIKVFGQYDSTLFSKINVIMNSDPRGEILDTYFIFKNDVVKQIKMQAPY